MAKTFTLDEIGQKLKQANPNKYASVSDRELARSYLRQKPQAGSILHKESTASGFSKGVGKSLLGTVKESAGLGERLFGSALKTLLPKSVEPAFGISEKTPTLGGLFGKKAQVQEPLAAQQLQTKAETGLDITEGALTEARTGAQKGGKLVGDIAQFVAPSGVVGKAGKTAEAIASASKLGKIGKFAAKIAPQVLADTGIGTLQTGSPIKGIATGLTSAAFPLAGAGISRIGRGAKSVFGKGVQGVSKKTGAFGEIIKDITPTKQGIVNKQITGALGITKGDIDNIANSTGNQVGEWISKNKLTRGTKGETQQAIETFFQENYNKVRSTISKVDKNYSPSEIPRFVDSLTEIKAKTDGVVGFETENALINSLLKREKVSLADTQAVKEMLDDTFSLYRTNGDNKEEIGKESIRRLRQEMRGFIEKEVKNTSGVDIRALNNNVATAKGITKATTKRASGALNRANLTLGDLGAFGAGSVVGSPLFGGALLFAKKVGESPTIRLRFAKWLDGLTSAKKAQVAKELVNGKIPSGLPKAIIQYMKNVPKAAVLGSGTQKE